MNGDLQYDYIVHQHGKKAADQWLQKKKLEETRSQNIINQYAPPLVSPDQMVRAAQQAVGTIPGGLLSEEGSGQMAPLTEEQRIMDEREQALAEAYTTPVPSQQDMWSKQARLPSSFRDPYQNAQMNPLPEQYAGTPINFDTIPSSPASPHGQDFDPFAGESIPFDHPSIAGERITDHPKFNNVAGLLETSPEQMRAMQEQIGGPGFWEPPRFAAANQAQMGMGLTKSDRSDPNFNAPEFTRSGTPGGITKLKKSKKKGKGWESDSTFDDDNNQNAYRPNPMWGELIKAGANIYGGRRG